MIHLSWQAPVFVHGTLTGYQLSYHIRGHEDDAEQRTFDADKQHFTTTFLGMITDINILSRLSTSN